MTDFISVISFEGRFASYHITSDKHQTYTARLLKSTGGAEAPAQIVIHKNDQPTYGMEKGLKEKLANAIAVAEDNADAIS